MGAIFAVSFVAAHDPVTENRPCRHKSPSAPFKARFGNRAERETVLPWTLRAPVRTAWLAESRQH